MDMSEAIVLIAVALISGGVGLLGVMLGSDRQAKTAAAERAAAHQQEHNDRAAEVLGHLSDTLATLSPDGLAFNFDSEESPDLVRSVVADAQAAQRQLAVIAAGHPSQHVRSGAWQLVKDINMTIRKVDWMLTVLSLRNQGRYPGADRSASLSARGVAAVSTGEWVRTCSNMMRIHRGR